MSVDYNDELQKYNESLLAGDRINPLDDQKNPVTPYEPEKEVDIDLVATDLTHTDNPSGDDTEYYEKEATKIINTDEASLDIIPRIDDTNLDHTDYADYVDPELTEDELAEQKIVLNVHDSSPRGTGIDLDGYDYTNYEDQTLSETEKNILSDEKVAVVNPKTSNEVILDDVLTGDEKGIDLTSIDRSDPSTYKDAILVPEEVEPPIATVENPSIKKDNRVIDSIVPVGTKGLDLTSIDRGSKSTYTDTQVEKEISIADVKTVNEIILDDTLKEDEKGIDLTTIDRESKELYTDPIVTEDVPTGNIKTLNGLDVDYETYPNERITTRENGIYQPVGSGPLGTAILDIANRSVGQWADSTDQYEAANITDLSTMVKRPEDSLTSDTLRFFLYNNVPYVLGEVAEALGSITRTVTSLAASGGSSIVNEIGSIKALLEFYNNLQYYTLKEIGLSFTATFGTLQLLPFTKGLSIKYRKSDLFKGKMAQEFGKQDARELLLGEETSGDVLQRLFNKAKDFLGKLVPANTDGDHISSWHLLELQKVLDETRDDIAYDVDTKNYKSLKEMKMLGVASSSAYSFMGSPKDQKTTFRAPADIGDGEESPIGRIHTNITDFRNLNDIKLLKSYITEHINNLDGSEDIYGKDGKVSLTTVTDAMSESYKQFTGNISKITNLKAIGSIGHIYVYPTTTDNGIGNFKIPLQFTPVLNESGQAARYESMNMLHRQGSVMSYVQTEGETLTLETEYLMTSDGREELTEDQKQFVSLPSDGPILLGGGNGDNGNDAWYDVWTPETIQAIERVMRSLVLPTANDKGNGEVSFHKPPVIKIVIGEYKPDGDPAQNGNLFPMLTYPIKGANGTKFYHRTYVVTKVNVIKDMIETPLYVDDKGYLIDTHGFKLTLELAEIDYNYIGVLPDFGEYYNSYSGLASAETAV